MSLNINEIEKLAKLARLELTPDEKKKYAGDISSLLQYVDRLQEINVKQITESDDQAENLREDKVIGIGSRDQVELIKMAPESEEGLIRTKPVF